MIAAGGWPGVLTRLVSRQDLTRQQAAEAMAEILEGAASPAQIGAFLVGLRAKGETVEELTGLLDAMLDASERVPLPEPSTLVDTCGTGGDRSHSINVSTLAALVVAASGARVCKHGNRAATSAAGSADLLEALGVAIDLGPAGVARCVTEAGFGFCFAPRFHPAMRHAGPPRRELGIPTVFNFLGPLANPARVGRQVVGVSDASMADRMVRVLQARRAPRAFVVYGHDGLDELTTTTTSTVLDLHEGEVRTYVVDPIALGLDVASADQLRGGDARANADHARRVLDGVRGPHRDVVLLNAAAGLVVSGVVADLDEGLARAAASVDDGRAARVLDRAVEVSQAARAAGE